MLSANLRIRSSRRRRQSSRTEKRVRSSLLLRRHGFSGSLDDRLAMRAPVAAPLSAQWSELLAPDRGVAAAARLARAARTRTPAAPAAGRRSWTAPAGPGWPAAAAGRAAPPAAGPARSRPESGDAGPAGTAPRRGRRCRCRPGFAGPAKPHRRFAPVRRGSDAGPPRGPSPSRAGRDPRCPTTMCSSGGRQEFDDRQPITDGVGVGRPEHRPDLERLTAGPAASPWERPPGAVHPEVGVQGVAVAEPEQLVLAAGHDLLDPDSGEIGGGERRHPEFGAGQVLSRQRLVQASAGPPDRVSLGHRSSLRLPSRRPGRPGRGASPPPRSGTVASPRPDRRTPDR